MRVGMHVCAGLRVKGGVGGGAAEELLAAQSCSSTRV